jgi:hypothetical protein
MATQEHSKADEAEEDQDPEELTGPPAFSIGTATPFFFVIADRHSEQEKQPVCDDEYDCLYEGNSSSRRLADWLGMRSRTSLR